MLKRGYFLLVSCFKYLTFRHVFFALIFLTLSFILYPLPYTHAQQSGFIPGSGDLKISEEKIISLKLNSGSKISGFDLKFTTTGPLIITDFADSLSFTPELNPFDSRQITEKINGSGSQLAYVFTTAENNLPSEVTVYIKVKGSASGQGKISLDYNQSRILDGGGKSVQVVPLNAIYNLNPDKSSTGFIDPASLPPVKYQESAAVLNIKTRLSGAAAFGAKIKATAVAVGRIGEGHYETLPTEFYLTGNSDGTFSGVVAFPNFKDGNKFSIMLKADKYLLRRLCNTDASEQKLGAYICQTPSLTIRSGETANFDFSKVALIPGDLGVIDGVLNGYDLSLVRNNLDKKTAEAVGLADLNLDAIVDAKDFEIINYAALNTRREGDQ